jgi:hypothetical protein
MMNKIKCLFLLVFAFGVLGFSANALAFDDEMVAVSTGKLTAINLPSGARRVHDDKVPVEIKDTLSKLIASGGEGITEGGSEVVLWEGNYKKTRGEQMIQNLEAAFKDAGWQYERGEKSAEFTTFVVFRPQPAPRALVGFFIPSGDVFVFAVAEMLKSDGQQTVNSSSKKNAEIPAKTNFVGDSNLSGKWFRTVGGGSIDWTGKTQYKAGENFYFEFFPDGTVEYTREKDVLSIMQCRITEKQKARGRYAVSGRTLKIDLGAMSSVGSNSCDAKGNFNKTLEPSNLTVEFEIKKMESLTRPDKPTIMCFDGSDDVCYEKVNR